MAVASSKNVFFMQTRNRRTDCCTISHPGLLILLSISMGKHLKFCKPCCHDSVAGMSSNNKHMDSFIQELCNTVCTRAQCQMGNG
jgi:hypothetical protein